MAAKRPVTRHDTLLGHVLTLLISLLGVVAFSYPFWLAVLPQADAATARAGDAPIIFGLLMPLHLVLGRPLLRLLRGFWARFF